MTTIACYHAHHANIGAIEQALRLYEVELVHYVDPGLDRIKGDPNFRPEEAKAKVKETLGWMARCQADARLITCTYFAALANEAIAARTSDCPIIAIDEPLFGQAIREKQALQVVFTNPGTVGGTMRRLAEFAARAGEAGLKAEPVRLEGTFELFMQGRAEEYDNAVAEGLRRLIREKSEDTTVVAAQLSMANAAQNVEAETGVRIVNPLDSLAGMLENMLSLPRRAG